MAVDFNALMNAFNEAEMNHGLEGGKVLPKGTYPVEVEKVLDADVSSAKGTPFVRLQLRVLDGPFANQRAFVTHYMSKVASAEVQHAVAQFRQLKAAGVDIPVEIKKTMNFFNMSMTLLKDLGVPPRDISMLPEADPLTSLAFYNTDAWPGQRLFAGIGIDSAESQEQQAREQGRTVGNAQDRNTLTSHRPFDAEQMGNWQAKELPRQMRVAGHVPAAVTAGAAALRV